jgi:hypothetical protein
MKLNTLKKITLCIGFVGVSSLFAQNLLYIEKHKEVEYNFAIIDSGTFEELTETEKIKYELRYSETNVTNKISSDFSQETEIIYDSNGYSKDWLKLPKRMVYNNAGIMLYSEEGDLMNTIEYSEEQIIDRANDKIDVEQNGYHPGLISFPVGSPSLYSQLTVNGIRYQDYGLGKFSITADGSTTTYDKSNLLITTERIDEIGNKVKEYDGYIQMENSKGYLQVISKTETAIKSIEGPCLTAVKLIYYLNYQIEDVGQLINKSLQPNSEKVTLYPNPNQGVFTIQVQLNQGNIIQQVRILNMISGQVINLGNSNTNSIDVNMPDMPLGVYAVQVQTNHSILTSQFIKQ